MVEKAQHAEKRPKIYLMPCSGIPDRGIPVGHVYTVKIGNMEVTYLPLELARERYPGAKISRSTDLCPSCVEAMSKLVGL